MPDRSTYTVTLLVALGHPRTYLYDSRPDFPSFSSALWLTNASFLSTRYVFVLARNLRDANPQWHRRRIRDPIGSDRDADDAPDDPLAPDAKHLARNDFTSRPSELFLFNREHTRRDLLLTYISPTEFHDSDARETWNFLIRRITNFLDKNLRTFVVL